MDAHSSDGLQVMNWGLGLAPPSPPCGSSSGRHTAFALHTGVPRVGLQPGSKESHVNLRAKPWGCTTANQPFSLHPALGRVRV